MLVTNKELMDAGGPDLGTAEWKSAGTKQDLIDNVMHGYLTAIMFTCIASDGIGQMPQLS